MPKERVMQIVQMRGPVLPMHVAKALNLNSIMAGAYLSELLSNKRIKISNLKIGGSPVYYVNGQEHKLQDHINTLKAPERKAVEMLKEKKVLKDSEQEPVIRVALRNAKDFAKPLEISQNSHTEIFWKWYLTSNDEVQDILRPVHKPESQPVQEPKRTPAPEPSLVSQPIQKQPIPKPEPKPTPPPQERQEPVRELHKEEHRPRPVERRPEVIKQPPLERKPETVESPKGEFAKKILSFFTRNKIDVLTQNIVRVDSEIDFELLIPSAVGKVHYFAVAKSKKRCTDADLSQLYVKAEMKKLPALFIYSGDITKKAREMLKREFRIITTYKI